MSEKLTRIRLPGQNDYRGFMDWGEVEPAKIIHSVRDRAAQLRREAEAIEAATDDEFQIDVIRGPYVQHHVRELQKSSRTPSHHPNLNRERT
ncbi:hypothetical protein CO670_15375 [Rhizobium sp. J15]|uniref:hypothetical protein n=1 Tax=Rhizobium sp. J15 TaxID=2035450 RepID=UPI000BEA826F|nr:hypothetical protein [Rhizobium sp. J15]PDT15876.1 hypothetical protein CO670_15375 [Rhizobium sp. J15]